MLAFVLRKRFALLNLALWAVFAWLLYQALYWAMPLVLPLLLGSLIAVLIEPVVKLLLRLKLPRWLASALTLLLFFGGGATLLLLLAAKLAIELADFTKRVPDLTTGLVVEAHDWMRKGIEFYGTLSPAMTAKVQENLDKVSTTLTALAKNMAGAVLNGLAQVPTLVTIALLSLIICYFVSKDFPKLQRMVLSWIHPTVREKGDVVLDDLGRAVFGYIRAQAILITITFVQVLAGLLILGVDYAFSLSLLAAFLDILPLLGTGSLFVPWAVFLLVTGSTKLGVGLLIVYGLVVAVRQVLEPKILASSIGLDPLLTIIVMYAGYKVLGFLGVLLAPFLIIAFMSLVKVRAFEFLVDDTKPDLDEPDDPDKKDR
jgi:sporulation integral membrane protein YtvI